MPPRLLMGRVALLLVFAVFLTTDLVSIGRAVSLAGRPFAGFLITERMDIDFLGLAHWTGVQAGLKYPDRLLEADGHALSSKKDLDRVLQTHSVGDTVRYLISRDGMAVTVDVPTMVYTWSDLLVRFGISFLIGNGYFLLAIALAVLKPDTTLTTVSVLSSLFLGYAYLLELDILVLHSAFSRSALHVAHGFAAASVCHLSLLFPQRWPLLDRTPAIAIVPYAVALGLVAAAEHLYPNGAWYSSVYLGLISYVGFSALLLLASSLWSYIWFSSVIGRARAKVVLFGAALALPVPSVSPVLSYVNANYVTIPFVFSELPLIIFPASITYAIAKHNLFDVDVYIKRTVGYVLMTSIVAGAYFVFQTVVKTAVLDPLLGEFSEKVYPFLFALLTVFAFNPLSQQVQQIVDKLFYRKLYDYKATVAAVSESLTSLVDVQAFIDKVIHTVRANLFVDRAGVILLDVRTNSSQSTFRGRKFGQDATPPEEMTEEMTGPCVFPDDPLLVLLAREKKLITKYDVAEDPRYGPVRESCGQRFEELGASLALPLYYRDQFAGALALGYKKSGHFYTREDIDLLKTLSSMTSTAIEQSREKGQKAVLMQLFSKHVSPQVAESLWEQREQFLEGGRPKSQSMTVTAMFTDLQGFSTISEKQSPEVLMSWLNTYLEMMTNTVMEFGGVVDDFFGDGVKINFGVPIPRETEDEIRQDAVNAINCALAMEQRMIILNEKMVEQGQQPLRMRIGIYTGPVVAGSLGSAERMKYTTIGDTVNTAARLESFDKDLVIPRVTASPCRILIGKPTLGRVGGIFDVEKVGELSLKGKAERIGAYCVLGVGSGGSVRMTQGVGHADD